MLRQNTVEWERTRRTNDLPKVLESKVTPRSSDHTPCDEDHDPEAIEDEHVLGRDGESLLYPPEGVDTDSLSEDTHHEEVSELESVVGYDTVGGGGRESCRGEKGIKLRSERVGSMLDRGHTCTEWY
jgi:hypothetical protein